MTLHLDFDTGSSDLWVWRCVDIIVVFALITIPSSSELANASQFSGHTIYNPAASSTAERATGSWSLSYGDGSRASGDIYTDTVTIGDVVVPNQVPKIATSRNYSLLTNFIGSGTGD